MLKLEKDQEDLLSSLVEAARSMPSGKRSNFLALNMVEGSHIAHSGLSGGTKNIYWGDIIILDREGLISIIQEERSLKEFDITPRGFAYYEWMKNRDNHPISRVESEIRTFLEEDNFIRTFPNAYKKWRDAVTILWSSDSNEQFTTIGHLCREAMQEFVTKLIELYKPESVDTNSAHTKSRLKSVIEKKAKDLGDTEKIFLNSLIQYWDALNELVQRQEHGNQKVTQPLEWEDGRRLVFQTAVVMFEIERSLSR